MDIQINKKRKDGKITLSIQKEDKESYIVINSFPTENFRDSKLRNIGKISISIIGQKDQQILIPDVKYDNTYFGYDICVSEDGNILAVGCPGNTYEDVNGVGSVFIYKLINNRFVLRDIVIPERIIPNLYFGSYVKINGNILNIGCLSLSMCTDELNEDIRLETINLEKLSIDNYKSKVKQHIKYRRR